MKVVIYSETKKDCFSNLAIDEDGDISYTHFNKDRTKSHRKLFYYTDGLDYKMLSNLLK